MVAKKPFEVELECKLLQWYLPSLERDETIAQREVWMDPFLTGALNWKSADNLSVNISFFKADHFSRNTRLMFLFVILNLHLLDSRSWGEEEKQQLVVKGCWAEESFPGPLPPPPTVSSTPAQNGHRRGWHFPRLGKVSLVAKSHSGPQQPASDLCSMVLCCQKCMNW